MAKHRIRAGAGALGLLVALALAVVPATATATVITPNTFTDDVDTNGNCTLREAIIAANTDAARDGCTAGSGNDALILSAGTFTLSIPPSVTFFDPLAGELVVNDPDGGRLAIVGFSGATIDANGQSRVISALSQLKLSSLTVTGGAASLSVGDPGLGGAVLSSGGSTDLDLEALTAVDNTATVRGGAVHAAGPLTVANSTITANSVHAPGPGAGTGGGGISAAGALTVNRSTIAANVVDGVDDNTALGGGVLYDGTLSLTGSILYANTADGGVGSQCSGAGSTSGGYNVIETTAGCTLTTAGTDVGSDPALAPLADNGGPAQTMAIPPTSPAFNIGPASAGCAGLEDQRRVPRGVGDIGGPCDAGAYELAICAGTIVNEVGTQRADVLTGSPGPQSVLGLGANDAIFGSAGGDALCGNDGEDVLDGGGGGDILFGGAGIDTADYSSASAPVTLTLDLTANDGAASEGDNVITESAIGGPFGDQMTGDDSGNSFLGGDGADILTGGGAADSLFGEVGDDSLLGGTGNDVIGGNTGTDTAHGEDGNDRIAGDAGNDVLDGADGSDVIRGAGGNDRLLGGAGNDLLDGGSGRDTLLGGDGNDHLIGGPAKDKIGCGGGKDSVEADKKDVVAGDCEKVTRT